MQASQLLVRLHKHAIQPVHTRLFGWLASTAWCHMLLSLSSWLLDWQPVLLSESVKCNWCACCALASTRLLNRWTAAVDARPPLQITRKALHMRALEQRDSGLGIKLHHACWALGMDGCLLVGVQPCMASWYERVSLASRGCKHLGCT